MYRNDHEYTEKKVLTETSDELLFGGTSWSVYVTFGV